MSVRHVSDGDFVNESERKAFERIRNALERHESGGGRGPGTPRPPAAHPSPENNEWVIFTNLNHVYDRSRRSEEIDMVVVGPTGVFVIEVKPWEHNFLARNSDLVTDTAIAIDAKAKHIKGTLTSANVHGFVTARILLTADTLRLPSPQAYAGVSVCGLGDWKELLNVNGRTILGPDDFDNAERVLFNPSYRRRTGGFTSIGEIELDTDGYLEPESEPPGRRVWRGRNRDVQDKLIVHLYDLGAKGWDHITARRDFEAMQRLQRLDFVPRIYHSYADHPDYPGEMAFFSVIDTLATPVEVRGDDLTWALIDRLRFALGALRAVDRLHEAAPAGTGQFLHRSLNPATVRVLSTNEPTLTGFGFARIPSGDTLASLTSPRNWGGRIAFVAPELVRDGIGAADIASDVYSICATLMTVVDPALLPEGMAPPDEQVTDIARTICATFEQAKDRDPSQRPALKEIVSQLDSLLRGLTEPNVPVPLPLVAPERWDEATEVSFGNSRYRVRQRIGEGGIGNAFKVVEIDPRRGDELGTFVAKTISDESTAEDALRAYRVARQHTVRSLHIATIHDVADTWSETAIMCLVEWIDGISLDYYAIDLVGEVERRAGLLGDETPATLLLKWMRQVCDGLQTLHEVGLVHGDVSPANIIACGDDLVAVQLTDFDAVIEVDRAPRFRNPRFACAEVMRGDAVARSDDLYALAASMYHVLTYRIPFDHDGTIDRARGLGWRDDDAWDDMRGFAQLRQILDQATHPDRAMRYGNASVAREVIEEIEEAIRRSGEGEVVPPPPPPPPPPPLTRERRTNERLQSLLAMYPGSRHGNAEARGLDSDFARQTYVESRLDTHMLELVERNEVSLVLLFGNAGDGKTAFLQNLASRLSPGARPASADHVWEGTIRASGVRILINLDGSASGNGRSADQMLDDVFGHFHNEHFVADRVHMVAVNSGKLLDWIQTSEERPCGETWLTRQLRRAMGDWAHDDDDISLDPRIRLIDLNDRSLVGRADPSDASAADGFFEALVERLVGGDDAWQVCRSCISQDVCPAYGTVRAMQEEQGEGLIRRRLRDALQACHQRGVVHITSRELRGALSYILFGIHTCEEIHAGEAIAPVEYWNRAFDAAAGGRSHPLLAELASLDPGNECDPATDRRLVKDLPRRDDGDGAQMATTLRGARRKAWFTEPDADGQPTVSLVGSRSQRRFRDIAAMDEDRRQELLADLCEGLARIEDLPEQAFRLARKRGQVPIRISPRTPTETILWTATKLDRFRVEAGTQTANADLFDQLHTEVRLSYDPADGRPVATLTMGLGLFDILLSAQSGAKLTSALQEGQKDHLSVFSERLAQEGAREVLAWHPSRPDDVFRVRAEHRGDRQVITLAPLTEGDADGD